MVCIHVLTRAPSCQHNSTKKCSVAKHVTIVRGTPRTRKTILVTQSEHSEPSHPPRSQVMDMHRLMPHQKSGFARPTGCNDDIYYCPRVKLLPLATTSATTRLCEQMPRQSLVASSGKTKPMPANKGMSVLDLTTRNNASHTMSHAAHNTCHDRPTRYTCCIVQPCLLQRTPCTTPTVLRTPGQVTGPR